MSWSVSWSSPWTVSCSVSCFCLDLLCVCVLVCVCLGQSHGQSHGLSHGLCLARGKKIQEQLSKPHFFTNKDKVKIIWQNIVETSLSKAELLRKIQKNFH